ncbi:Extracellular exo-alpha-L-arabinofuranosidase precursor [compost metagenome]
MAELDPYVQDALDLIEFANGSVDTPWGIVRSDMGHPKPFNLKHIGVSNEQ